MSCVKVSAHLAGQSFPVYLEAQDSLKAEQDAW